MLRTEHRVGPKGYIHGWIFVGAPGIGAQVFHPHHGRGTVTAHSGTHATVKFASGTEHSFAARPGTGPARLEPIKPEKALTGQDVHAHLGSPDLTPSQAKALDRYQATLYHQLNAYLWTGDPHAADEELGSHTVSETELKRVTSELDGAFRRAQPTTAPITVYRGMSGLMPANPKPGQVTEFKGYMSTSADPEAISVFTWNKAGTEQERPWRITVPAGSKAISEYNRKPLGNAAEGEVLLPRGSRLRVTAVGRDHIDAELVPGGAMSRAYPSRRTAETPTASTVHEPFGSPSGPGLFHHKGLQLPAYVQHVAHHLAALGHPESQAIQMAIGVVKDWAAGRTPNGKGHVHPDVQAAAAKAVAEWEAAKASAHGSGRSAPVRERGWVAPPSPRI